MGCRSSYTDNSRPAGRLTGSGWTQARVDGWIERVEESQSLWIKSVQNVKEASLFIKHLFCIIAISFVLLKWTKTRLKNGIHTTPSFQNHAIAGSDKWSQCRSALNLHSSYSTGCILFVWKSIQKQAYFSLDLWSQLSGSKDFYGLNL